MKIEFSKEQLMKLLLQHRKRVLRIGIILFTLFIALIMHRIQTKQIKSLQVNKDAELKKNGVLNEISRAEKAFQLYKNLLSQKDLSSVMNTVNGIARDSKVRLISIKPEREEKQPLYSRAHFILVIGADDYHAIGKFISRIESYPDIYFVEGISIRPQEESRTPDKELTGASKPANKLIVNLILSIIAFKG